MTPPVGGRTSVQRISLFALGTLAGGLVTGLFVFLMGAVMIRWLGNMSLIAPAVMIALGFLTLPAFRSEHPAILSGTWVIPRRWAAYGRGTFAVLFGFNLGLGWRTRVGSNHFWALVAGTILVPRLHLALLPFLAFAMTRALPVVIIYAVRATLTRHRHPGLTLSDARLLGLVSRSKHLRYATILSGVALGAAIYAFWSGI